MFIQLYFWISVIYESSFLENILNAVRCHAHVYLNYLSVTFYSYFAQAVPVTFTSRFVATPDILLNGKVHELHST
jgi:hypothetical protein